MQGEIKNNHLKYYKQASQAAGAAARASTVFLYGAPARPPALISDATILARPSDTQMLRHTLSKPLRRALLPQRPTQHNSSAAAPLPSTEALHADPLAPCAGPFAPARLALDYGWHGRYSLPRQRLQDGLIAARLAAAAPPPPPGGARPWLVHTCGAMGAGKSHVMRWLGARGAFPLAAFVRVDPDALKGALPEAAAFMAQDRASAGTRMHKESLLLADVLTQCALAEGRNVLVDGSMRNSQWYAEEWARLRVAAPRHRLAVLLVTAPRASVHARAARRAAETGREVPRGVLEDSIARAPATFELLRHRADFAAVVDNAGPEPTLLPEGATLEGFARTWEGCA